MGGDLHAETVRCADRGGDFGVGHELLARVVAGGGYAARGHDLDQIGAPPLMLAHSQPSLFGCVDNPVIPAGM